MAKRRSQPYSISSRKRHTTVRSWRFVASQGGITWQSLFRCSCENLTGWCPLSAFAVACRRPNAFHRSLCLCGASFVGADVPGFFFVGSPKEAKPGSLSPRAFRGSRARALPEAGKPEREHYGPTGRPFDGSVLQVAPAGDLVPLLSRACPPRAAELQL